jgi:hypothetical protein
MLTRFALCTAVHSEAFKRIIKDEKLSYAIGVAFAIYYAILKNSRKRYKGDERNSNNGKKFYQNRKSNTNFNNFDKIISFGKMEIRINSEIGKAWLKLGENYWVEGSYEKGIKEVNKVPKEIKEKIKKELDDNAISSEKNLFNFYARIRDELKI